MKNLSLLAICLSVLSTVTSYGIFDPQWERPIQRAALSEAFAHEAFSYPVAVEVTMHQRDGAKNPTVFSLVEDTGIRCVTTPCPSDRTTLFNIVGINQLDKMTIEYKAVEVPRVTEHGKVVNGLRTLKVVDFSGFQQQWNVRVEDHQGRSRSYVGYPEGVATIESAISE